ncbi:T9SS type A sorting domain-containing protein [Flammeovirga kamogawensis]|uniref:T9SS type A sorting domain-containing protein n=1 Tax=Flammeovirga kamogawensis TaxID=373891 RepID=A0ABX8GU86_9BACT|nr:T9SS type A sorting domain-containing protein [Flammeovirga kamogawensis]MBB6462975.1 hypothetical protein [Flammeovirga kamogawensis]QWG06500.1 T9SS type A sorting domain-containing protein [Flammeovirga kamogawensis]TRX68328.1 T9SS type A sorting domain-containing protein [Flammeovirga kamogawensis]
MKLNTPFLLCLILGVFSLNTYGQCDDLVTNFNSNVTFSSSASCGSGSSIILESNTSNRQLIISNGTVVIDVGEGGTLDLSSNSVSFQGGYFLDNNGIDLIINEGATLIINGSLELNSNSTLTVNGELIVSGNIETFDVNSCFLCSPAYVVAYDKEVSDDVEFTVGSTGKLHIGGNADFGYSNGSGGNRMFINGSIDIDNSGNDFDSVPLENNVDPDGPFSSTLSITYSTNSHIADFFKSDSVSAHSDFDAKDIATTIMTGIHVSAATGWFGKEVRVASSEGFLADELKVNKLNGKVIYSLQDLEDALHSIKWQIKDNDVKKELAKYHKNGQNKKIIDPEKVSAIQTYFDIERKITIEFVAEGSSSGRTGELLTSNQRIASIPEITITSNSEDLPVTLVSFEAYNLEDNSVALEWTTATEINNSHFEIWRSTDNKSWNLLAKIDSEGGNSNYAIDYAYVDEHPLNLAYYKLIQYDFDGVNESFGPLKVTSLYKEEKMITKVYPNNISSSANATNIVINGLMSYQREIEIQLYDQQGNILIEEHLNNIKTEAYLHQFSLPNNLTTGMYYVVISSGTERTKNKVIVN